jgi:rare lipoprotein A
MTFAHRTMPFGTKIKVVNQDNGRSVILRGNDRGPFHGSRIIDLSEGAFARIASTSQGLARVCISKL